jgi:hypothetical protein
MSCRFNSFFHLFLLLFGLIFLMVPIGTLAQAATLQHIASYPLNEGESAMGVTISGNIAYVACDYGGIKLLDISNPSSPVYLGGCSTPSFARNIFVRGNYAYIADGDAGLQIAEISNSAAPAIIGSYEIAGTAVSVTVAGEYAYLADGYSGLLILNVANPTSPTLVGTYFGAVYPMGVALVGNYAYVTASTFEPDQGQLQAVDITDPANPTFVDGANFGGGAYGVSISGNYAYMGAYGYGMGIFNISNPGHPALVGSYGVLAPGSVKRTFAADTLVFFANSLSGFTMLNVSSPLLPVAIDSVDTFGNTSDVVMSGDYVYVADDYSLEIYRMVVPSACHYIPGDVGGSGTFTGLDITYMVRFFKGGPRPPYSCECTPGNTWYVSGDVNGSCSFTGLDISYSVRYFKGGPPPIPCPNCPPVRR